MSPTRFPELATARRVLRLAHHERGTAALVAGLGLAAAIFEGVGLSFLIPLATVATGGAFNTATPVIGPLVGWLGSHVELDGVRLVLFVVGFFFLGIVVGYLNLVISNMLSMRFAHVLRMRVFETALDRPLSAVESLPSGQFINNLATETWKVCDALFVLIGVTVQAITFVTFLVFLFLLSPLNTMVLLVMTGAMALVVHVATRAVRGLGREAVGANEAFMSYVWDAVGGLRVIRGFGREAHERRRFAESSDRVRAIFVRMRILSGVVGPITQMMTVAMVATILGIAMVRGDQIATLIGFLAIAYRMQPRISSLLSARIQLRGLEASVASVEAALDRRPAAGALPVRPFAGLQRGLTLEHVSARYPNAERPALHDVSCTFPSGKVTAVAGHSGAGKSTLVALLLRFLEPEKGRILVDGVPLSEIDPESWHRRIAFVEQNAFLFNASVRDNIVYGDLQAGPEAVEAAAQVAQADGFIRALPHGYDAVIGDSGVRLSQGQRQRVALARSLLRNADVLILDEATNALDRPTERALRDAIDAGRRDRVVIVIAHRRETIETADQVVVIEDGRIAEVGTPAELSRRGGVYTRLYFEDTLSVRA